MKKLIINTCFFIGLLTVSLLQLLQKVDGYTDPFYFKFTSPKQESLILGSSKASLGLVPSVMQDRLKQPIYNFAFTIGSSPYGPLYFNSIKKKVDPETQNGIFILTVDPWAISHFSKNNDDPKLYRENIGPVGETEWVSTNPNLLYAFNGGDNLFKKILKKKDSSLYLHRNGWLETFISSDVKETKERTFRAIEKLKNREAKIYKLSPTRINYLEKTIEFLNNHGSIFLVRLPVAHDILMIENKYDPSFNSRIIALGNKLNVPYLNMNYSKEKYKYTDGVHLQKESAYLATRILTDWIMESNLK